MKAKVFNEMITPDPLVMTLKETASFLRLSEITVIRLANQGSLPGTKLGKQWRFSRTAIHNLVQGIHLDIISEG